MYLKNIYFLNLVLLINDQGLTKVLVGVSDLADASSLIDIDRYKFQTRLIWYLINDNNQASENFMSEPK